MALSNDSQFLKLNIVVAQPLLLLFPLEPWSRMVNQCYNKMHTLKRRYRQIVDHNAQSGNDRKEWIYLEVMNNKITLEEIFCNKPWIKPLSVAGSNIQEPEKSVFDDDENVPPTKQKKISLNEERVHYLQTSLEEKRLKREETANYRAEKLKILKELKAILKK
ncbi:PREDICTED: uncharacterized protein LOC108764712 [Trachymyrmex cornetzi]|uniref:uncharacterized protein LOC108764712 n=1 Tax=Trachymyrmex cornetzi TaxID=471704 RepID=UPI00084EF324|nr:PREDICTED: uncharacterized protein LOC108764712 [Trachymyrmex cornetzi]